MTDFADRAAERIAHQTTPYAIWKEEVCFMVRVIREEYEKDKGAGTDDPIAKGSTLNVQSVGETDPCSPPIENK